MAKKKTTKKYERGRDRGEVVYVGAEIDNEVARAMQQYNLTNGVTKQFMIETGLKMFLQSKGQWPPSRPSSQID